VVKESILGPEKKRGKDLTKKKGPRKKQPRGVITRVEPMPSPVGLLSNVTALFKKIKAFPSQGKEKRHAGTGKKRINEKQPAGRWCFCGKIGSA